MPDWKKAVTEALAEELRAESSRHNLTQSMIARHLNRSAAYTSDRWHGRRSLTVEDLIAWTLLVDKTPMDILEAALLRVGIIDRPSRTITRLAPATKAERTSRRAWPRPRS